MKEKEYKEYIGCYIRGNSSLLYQTIFDWLDEGFTGNDGKNN
jgi:hypothetical protein